MRNVANSIIIRRFVGINVLFSTQNFFFFFYCVRRSRHFHPKKPLGEDCDAGWLSLCFQDEQEEEGCGMQSEQRQQNPSNDLS